MKNVEVEFLMIMCKCGLTVNRSDYRLGRQPDHLYETIEQVRESVPHLHIIIKNLTSTFFIFYNYTFATFQKVLIPD